MPQQFSRALITGASSGIGAAIATAAAQRKMDLVLVARRMDRMVALADDLRQAYGVRVEVLTADLTTEDGLLGVERRLDAEEEPVDLLVNNAGWASFGSFWQVPLDGELRQVALNVLAPIRLTHHAAGGMVRRRSGGVLNVSSTGGFQPSPHNVVYSSTKGFMISFTEALHDELRTHGVHATVLCPGFTPSEMHKNVGLDVDAVPAWMWLDPGEVARAGLDGVARNKTIVVPGTFYRVVTTINRYGSRRFARWFVGQISRRTMSRRVAS